MFLQAGSRTMLQVADEANSATSGRHGWVRNAFYKDAVVAEEFPDDADGQVLKNLAEGGNDLSKPMVVDFFVAAATEDHAESIAAAAEKAGYEAVIDFDDGEDAPEDEEITDPWTCTCRKRMLLEYDAVIAAQTELDELAQPFGGYADGWGTFGNVLPETS